MRDLNICMMNYFGRKYFGLLTNSNIHFIYDLKTTFWPHRMDQKEEKLELKLAGYYNRLGIRKWGPKLGRKKQLRERPQEMCMPKSVTYVTLATDWPSRPVYSRKRGAHMGNRVYKHGWLGDNTVISRSQKAAWFMFGLEGQRMSKGIKYGFGSSQTDIQDRRRWKLFWIAVLGVGLGREKSLNSKENKFFWALPYLPDFFQILPEIES